MQTRAKANASHVGALTDDRELGGKDSNPQ